MLRTMTEEAKPRLLPRLLKAVAVVLIADLLLVAAIYVKWTTLDHRLVTITPGAMYQSAMMPPDELVATCRELGIKTVIDLRDSKPDDVRAEAKAAADSGVFRHVHLPTATAVDLAAVHRFLEAMQTAERPVLVHCHHGESRSVMMAAIHRIQNEGWSNEGAFQATARLPESLRFLSLLVPPLFRFRDDDKGKMVLEYRPDPKYAAR
ncbi:MAG TPA: hypothetical protein ENI87_08850 [bacterium]|nr:hypothetical protein [bacterium]